MKKVLWAVLLAAGMAGNGLAEELVVWSSSNTSLLPTIAPVHAGDYTAGNITYGANAGSATTDLFWSSTFGGINGPHDAADMVGALFVRHRGTATLATNLTTAVSGSHYISFSIDPSGFGSTLDLDSVTVDLGITKAGGVAITNASFTYTLRSSLTGAADLDTKMFASPSTADGLYWNDSLTVFDLSSYSVFDEVASRVDFYLYVYYTGQASSPIQIARLDHLAINGLVIPEPSTWLLLGIGAGLLVLLRRRRNSLI